MKSVEEQLIDLRACGTAVRVFRKYVTMQEAYDSCDQARWLGWYLYKTSRTFYTITERYIKILCKKHNVVWDRNLTWDEAKTRYALDKDNMSLGWLPEIAYRYFGLKYKDMTNCSADVMFDFIAREFGNDDVVKYIKKVKPSCKGKL